MDSETRLIEALTRRCGRRPDGTPSLACEDAFALAVEFAVPVAELGRLCNEHGIRIVHCQLGCFA